MTKIMPERFQLMEIVKIAFAKKTNGNARILLSVRKVVKLMELVMLTHLMEHNLLMILMENIFSPMIMINKTGKY
jgi:hypothetical protein